MPRSARRGLGASGQADIFRLIVGRGGRGEAGSRAPDDPWEAVGAVGADHDGAGAAWAWIAPGPSVEEEHEHVCSRWVSGGVAGASWEQNVGISEGSGAGDRRQECRRRGCTLGPGVHRWDARCMPTARRPVSMGSLARV
jgi:hypothetical protein